MVLVDDTHKEWENALGLQPWLCTGKATAVQIPKSFLGATPCMSVLSAQVNENSVLWVIIVVCMCKCGAHLWWGWGRGLAKTQHFPLLGRAKLFAFFLPSAQNNVPFLPSYPFCQANYFGARCWELLGLFHGTLAIATILFHVWAWKRNIQHSFQCQFDTSA